MAGQILVGSIIGGVTGGLLSAFMGEDIFEGIKGGAKFGAIIGGFRGLGGAVGSYFGCGSTFVNICCKISRVSGKIAGGMFGFDIASMIGYKLGGEDNPIYQLNMACHSNDVYNYFQFGTNIVAAFTGGAASNKTCFIAGTLIVTGYGLSKIENIKPGDLVLSTNTDTMETGYKTVLEKYVRKTRELVHLVVGGEEIVSTADHPYFVVGRGFVNAGQLCIGSPLQNADGKILEVEQIYKEYLEEDEEVTVYNFQVEDWHTYHVGEMEVLVHNADYKPRTPKTGVKEKKENPDGSVTYTKSINGKDVSVTYSKEGYPDFSEFTHPEYSKPVPIKMTGNNKNDFRSANEKIGLSGSKPPTGYSWHHMEDGKNMLLVERQIHDCSIGGFPHTGGA